MKNRLLLSSILFFSLSGCYSEKPLNTDISSVRKNPSEKVVLNVRPMPVMPPTLKELSSIKDHTVSSPLINLSFDNVDLRQALLTVAKAAGYNIVVPPDVYGKVSLELKDETLDNSLRALLSPYGYSYEIKGNTIYVLSKVTRIFHINTIPGKRNFVSNIKANIGGGNGGTEGSSSVSGSTTMSIKNTLDYKFWDNVEDIVKTILQKDKTASYSLEPITGTLVVSGKPETVKEVADFVNKINLLSQRQVLIEAKILEVRLNRKYQLGIDWKFLLSGANDADSKYIRVINPYTGTGNLELKVLNVKNTFDAIIRALSVFGKVRVLSSPRILAVNDQPAMIKVGRDYLIVYQSQSTSTTTTGGQAATTITTQGVETQTILTEGLILTILPKIEADGSIVLNITPAISSLDEPLVSTSSSGATEGYMNKIYPVSVRQLNTVVRVKNGETVILGGLITEVKGSETEGVPFLEDVPLVGNAFKSKSNYSEKVELVIMLTPKLVGTGNGEE